MKSVFIYSVDHPAFLSEWGLSLSKALWDTMQGQRRGTGPDPWARWIEKNLDVPKLLHRQLCEHRLRSQLWSQSLKPGERRRWSPLTHRYIHKTHIMSSVCAGPNRNPCQSHVIVPEILVFGNSYNNKMTYQSSTPALAFSISEEFRSVQTGHQRNVHDKEPSLQDSKMLPRKSR